jgi:hypothetical protein
LDGWVGGEAFVANRNNGIASNGREMGGVFVMSNSDGPSTNENA